VATACENALNAAEVDGLTPRNRRLPRRRLVPPSACRALRRRAGGLVCWASTESGIWGSPARMAPDRLG